jgi:AcrR family transcriptional regulator
MRLDAQIGVYMNKKPGRPRSEETKKAILTASYELLLENGFKMVTIEGIAERAGVSKVTIYKWWPTKAAVVVDGYFAATEALLLVPDTGSVKDDLFIQVNNLASFITSPSGKVITELIAEGQHDANIAEEYRVRYFNPRRLISRSILERGVLRGELRKDLELEPCIDLIFAPIFYRLLITGDRIDESYTRELISYALSGLELKNSSDKA